MSKPNRPRIITLLACLNLLLGLGTLAYAVAAIVPNLEELIKSPAAPTTAAPAATGGRAQMTAPITDPAKIPPPPPAMRPHPDSDVLGVMKDQQKWLRGHVNYYEMYIYVVILVAAVLALLLFASAIGLLRLNPSGQQLTIFLAVVLPLAAAGSTYCYWEHIQPEFQKWEENRNNQFEKVFHEPRPKDIYRQAYGAWNIVVPSGIALYSVLLLVAMFLPSVRSAFYGQSPTPVDPSFEPVA